MVSTRHGAAAAVRAIRLANAELTLSASPSRGVRSSVVRLPPTNHGDGDNGFMATLVGIAREKGVSGYVGDGANRWPAVHRLDAAHLFRLALEQAPAGFDAARGRRRGRADPRDRRGDRTPPRRPGRVDRARGRGRALHLAGRLPRLDSPASSALTRELLDWQPTQPGLIDDLDQGHYFRN